MELERIKKPLRQMRKLLKSLPADPVPDEVHKLRTHARRIEAAAAALQAVDGKAAKQLLKAMKPVRKAAGGVRDMDVLTRDLLGADLLDAQHDGTSASRVRLLERLGAMRQQSGDALTDAVNRWRKPARRRLKKFERAVEQVAGGKKPARIEAARALQSEDGSGSRASELVDELRHWPKFNAQNIHPFRLKVKELRYVLQLFPYPDERLVAALGKVKDEIGDWHDWQQLNEIAHEVLESRADEALLEKIRRVEKQKLTRALAAAESLHSRSLHAGGSRRRAA